MGGTPKPFTYRYKKCKNKKNAKQKKSADLSSAKQRRTHFMSIKKLALTVATVVLIGAVVAWLVTDGFLVATLITIWEAIWEWMLELLV